MVHTPVHNSATGPVVNTSTDPCLSQHTLAAADVPRGGNTHLVWSEIADSFVHQLTRDVLQTPQYSASGANNIPPLIEVQSLTPPDTRYWHSSWIPDTRSTGSSAYPYSDNPHHLVYSYLRIITSPALLREVFEKPIYGNTTTYEYLLPQEDPPSHAKYMTNNLATREAIVVLSLPARPIPLKSLDIEAYTGTGQRLFRSCQTP